MAEQTNLESTLFFFACKGLAKEVQKWCYYYLFFVIKVKRECDLGQSGGRQIGDFMTDIRGHVQMNSDSRLRSIGGRPVSRLS
jgi:hypothetical protein